MFFAVQLLICVVLSVSNEIVGQVKSTDDDTIKIETSLVWVPVSIKTKAGTGVAALSRHSFKIFEDGVEQEITDFQAPGEPITVALVIDMSDSARISLAEMSAAAAAFIDRLESRDKALIVAFDKNVHRVIGATGDRKMLRLGLKGISTGGGTALYDTVEHVLTKSFQGVSGRKAVVMLTDGIDTSSVKATFETSATLAGEAGIAIFPIQYEPESLTTRTVSPGTYREGLAVYTTPSGESISSAHQRGTRYLRLLAASSGGRFQLADTTENLGTAFAQIAAELRALYYAGFYSGKEARKPEKRKLRVTVDAPEARVYARGSYVAKP